MCMVCACNVTYILYFREKLFIRQLWCCRETDRDLTTVHLKLVGQFDLWRRCGKICVANNTRLLAFPSWSGIDLFLDAYSLQGGFKMTIPVCDCLEPPLSSVHPLNNDAVLVAAYNGVFTVQLREIRPEIKQLMVGKGFCDVSANGDIIAALQVHNDHGKVYICRKSINGIQMVKFSVPLDNCGLHIIVDSRSLINVSSDDQLRKFTWTGNEVLEENDTESESYGQGCSYNGLDHHGFGHDYEMMNESNGQNGNGSTDNTRYIICGLDRKHSVLMVESERNELMLKTQGRKHCVHIPEIQGGVWDAVFTQDGKLCVLETSSERETVKIFECID